MAIASPLFQNLRGRLGNSIYYQWRGTTYVRLYAYHKRKKTTPKQQECQDIFANCTLFYEYLQDTVKDSWRALSKGSRLMPRNLFMRRNRAVFCPDRKIGDYEKLYISDGGLPQPANWRFSYTGGTTASLSWKFDPDEFCGAPTDRLYVVAIKEEFPLSFPILWGTVTRSEGTATFPLIPFMGKNAHIFAYFAAEDKSDYSLSRHWEFENDLSVDPEPEPKPVVKHNKPLASVSTKTTRGKDSKPHNNARNTPSAAHSQGSAPPRHAPPRSDGNRV
ncbi:MAG: hypothetical protein RR137_08075 [Odoribacter sp.]